MLRPLSILTGLCGLALLMGQAPPSTTMAQRQKACYAPGVPSDQVRRAMLRQLNDYRAAHGLAPLRYSKALELAANEHARDMFDRNYFSHVTPDGRTPADRAIDAGFCHRNVGENIAYGMNTRRTPAEAFEAWRTSPGHDQNMRRRNFQYVGMGHYRARTREGEYYIWVQVFANRK